MSLTTQFLETRLKIVNLLLFKYHQELNAQKCPVHQFQFHYHQPLISSYDKSRRIQYSQT